jgi:hypothetical protein
MILRIQGKTDHLLALYEPDLKNIPIQFIESVSTTLHHLRLQKDTVESVGLDAEFPSIIQSAIKCSRYDDSRYFFVSRSNPSVQDSGWFLGCDDPGHDHNDPKTLQRTSLYELACFRDDFVPFAALPPTSSILVRHQQIQVWHQDEKCAFKPGSYLHAKTTVEDGGLDASDGN